MKTNEVIRLLDEFAEGLYNSAMPTDEKVRRFDAFAVVWWKAMNLVAPDSMLIGELRRLRDDNRHMIVNECRANDAGTPVDNRQEVEVAL